MSSHERQRFARLILPSLVGMLFVSAAIGQTAQNTTTSFEYDAANNVNKITDGLLNATGITTDVLGRRTRMTDPGTATVTYTSYEYDLADQLTKVTDARNVITAYTVDGLGNLLQTVSGDTGTTINTYDEAGNVLTSKDAKQQLTSYKYDAVNRVTLVTYHDTSTVAYLYDQGQFAIGKLSRITDASGVTDYDYDASGRVKTETRAIGGVNHVTAYRYNGTGQLAGMTYPSGRKIDYVYDELGRITQIKTILGSVETTLVSKVTYRPFGPVETVTFGNGRSQTRTFDLDGRLSTYSLPAQTMVLGYDAASRITSVADSTNLPGATIYGYNLLDRLTSVQTPTSSLGFDYDAVGNRKQKVNNGATVDYIYSPTANRLTKVGAQFIATDVNGSITDKGNATFTYDVRGRMVSANTGVGIVNYTVNSLGQRVRKVTPSAATVFHYDGAGKLIAETTVTAGNSTTQEYVYLGDMPVAVLK